MAESTPRYISVFPTDEFGDPAIATLTNTAYGAFCRIRMRMWQSGGSVDKSVDTLRKACGFPVKKAWDAIFREIKPLLIEVENGSAWSFIGLPEQYGPAMAAHLQRVEQGRNAVQIREQRKQDKIAGHGKSDLTNPHHTTKAAATPTTVPTAKNKRDAAPAEEVHSPAKKHLNTQKQAVAVWAMVSVLLRERVPAHCYDLHVKTATPIEVIGGNQLRLRLMAGSLEYFESIEHELQQAVFDSGQADLRLALEARPA